MRLNVHNVHVCAIYAAYCFFDLMIFCLSGLAEYFGFAIDSPWLQRHLGEAARNQRKQRHSSNTSWCYRSADQIPTIYQSHVFHPSVNFHHFDPPRSMEGILHVYQDGLGTEWDVKCSRWGSRGGKETCAAFVARQVAQICQRFGEDEPRLDPKNKWKKGWARG